MTLKLDGRKFSQELEIRLQSEIKAGIEKARRPPGLAVIRVGDDPASEVYVANKQKACARIGIKSFSVHLPDSSTSEEVIAKIRLLNNNELVDGILLQLPLPKGLDEGPIIDAINPDKDADGLHTLNLGKLIKRQSGPRSCTPAGIMALLDRNNVPIQGKRAVVIGRSILVGQPMALMLQSANATVSVAHSYTRNLSELTKKADLLVVAAGRPRMIGSEHISPGCVVVDVGIHRLSSNDGSTKQKSKLCGDVRFEELDGLASALTPVPGGVGPMTVAMLMVNTVILWQEHCYLSFTLRDVLP